MPRHARRRIAHEPALDGLRGVAVVLVLLFHGGLGVVGGALGVDVFLVLSGFLITALLLAEHDSTDGVDLRAFWGRRVRRLVPAALAVVAAVVAHAAITGEADDALRLDALSSLGWWSNWRFAVADAGYFESFGAPSPLRHMWSLAVEEQWYLLWPVLVLALRRRLLPATLGLGAASAAAMWLLAGDVDRAHFGTDTRAQALLAGAALAVVVRDRPVASWRRPTRLAVTAAGIAGGAVVLWLSFRMPGTDERLYRGGHTLVAVATAAVVAAAILPAGPVRRALSPRPLRLAGRVSYGLYLWHWPVFVWLTPDDLGLGRWPTFAVRCAVTVALAALSWKLLERPALDRTIRLPRPRLALATAYAAVAVLVVGATLGGSGTVGGRSAVATAEPTLPAGFVADDPPPPPAAAPRVQQAAATRSILDSPPAPRTRTDDPFVTVVGDSTAWALAWEIDAIDGLGIQDGGIVGCGLHPAAVVINGRPEVRESVPVPCSDADDLWRWWAATTDPDVVLLGLGAWEVYDRELDDGTRLDVGSRAWRAWLRAELDRVTTLLAEAAPHAVIALADVPCYEERDLSLGGPASARNDPDRRAAVSAVFADFVAAHPERLRTLPLSTWLCDDTYERPDGIHLAPESARALWQGPLRDAVLALVPTAPG